MPTGQGCPPTPSETTPTKPARFDYAARLRELLTARGLNHHDFAEMLGSGCRIAREVLDGSIPLTVEHAQAIAEWLGISPDWMVRDDRGLDTPTEIPTKKPASFDCSARLRELLDARGRKLLAFAPTQSVYELLYHQDLGAFRLADVLDISTEWAVEVLNGTKVLDFQQAQAVANWLGVSPGWLFFNEGESKPTHRAPGTGGLAHSTAAHVPPAAEPRKEADQPDPVRCVDASAPVTSVRRPTPAGLMSLGERSPANARVGSDSRSSGMVRRCRRVIAGAAGPLVC